MSYIPPMTYSPETLEPKWQQRWAERHTNEPDLDQAPKPFYNLMMFPYPSAEGLHVGNFYAFTGSDVYGRFMRLCGHTVFEPIGFDAFGIHSENFALKVGIHPSVLIPNNIKNFTRQLTALGGMFDWKHVLATTDPAYYKWTQWLFLQLYHAGKAYKKKAAVNWCPSCKTVLANEQVVAGACERCGSVVEQRALEQWFFKITDYAERLLQNLDDLSKMDWSNSTTTAQRNWVGRNTGADIGFAAGAETIRVFTTRPDTLFGATFMVLAPEHPLVDRLTTAGHRAAVTAYQKAAAARDLVSRKIGDKDKTGVFTGGHAINPATGQPIPVWIADYVLMEYGTGAIMAVPAHDERDWEFARKFALPIREVVSATPRVSVGHKAACASEPLACFAGEGFAVNSGPLDGLPTADAQAEIARLLEAQGLGKKTVNYKLRDWLFSRQRYWGEPFPIVWEDGQHRALAASELPLTPPEMTDFKPTGTSEPPLAKATDWLRYSDQATRETNTMPQWAGSCWYYLRYCDARNADRFVGTDAERYWMTGQKDEGGRMKDEVRSADSSPSSLLPHPSSFPPQPGGVDLYVGGTEHAVLHLLYARFWHKVLHDLGHVSTPEPFQRLVNQGLILGEDGQKMSKSRGNVVNPDDVIAEYGADALRGYLMFMGPLEATKPWSMTGVEGITRFLARVWRLVMEEQQDGSWALGPVSAEAAPDKAQLRVIHASIKKLTADIEALSFNTALAQLMVCTNAFVNVSPRPLSAVRTLLTLLNPFAPHLTEELWENLAQRFGDAPGQLADVPWPAWDEALLIDDEMEIVIQVNGKVRDKMVVLKEATKDEVEAAARASAKIAEWTAGKEIKKVVVVPGKLVNIVVA